jgi:hypothetical protein
MTKKANRTEKILNWYESEVKKDEQELNKEKMMFISELKKIKKEDIIKQPEKLTLWMRIKRVLGI